MDVPDLELRIRQGTVVVSAGILGLEESHLEATLFGAELARRVETLARGIEAARDLDVLWLEESATTRPEPPAETLAQGLGTELFEALFAGGGATLLERARSRSSGRIRLLIEIDPRSRHGAALMSLPWELLFSRREEAFLALHRETAVLRRVPVPMPGRPIPRAGRLRILAVASQPSDAAVLDLDAECRALEGLDGRRGMSVVTLRDQAASLEAIRKALRDLRPHILHFMGHGSFDRESGRGVLHLTGPDGCAQPLAGGDLAELLREHPSVRLVVLNACDTARQDRDAAGGPFAGVAAAIVLRGVPNVIAMQRRIGDAAAIAFAEELYGRIEAGEPVDLAVTEARQKVRTTTGSLEWSTPALYNGDTEQLRIFRPSIGRSMLRASAACLAVIAPLFALAFLHAGDAPIELDVVASRIGFEVTERQAITAPIALDRVVARDLAGFLPPGEAAIRAGDLDRLDIEIATGDGDRVGALTLQPVVAAAHTHMVIEQLRRNRLRLAFDGVVRPLTVAADGSWRHRRRPGAWHAAASPRPVSVVLEPRDAQLTLDLVPAVRAGISRGLDRPIEVVRLAFRAVRETLLEDRTDIENVSTLLSGVIRVGRQGLEHAVGPDDLLGFDSVSGVVDRLELLGDGIQVRFRGRARGVTLTRLGAPPRSLMPSLLATWAARWHVLLPAFFAIAVLAQQIHRRWRRPRGLADRSIQWLTLRTRRNP